MDFTNTFTSTLIQKIREVKEEKHLTNEDIAELTGLPESTISRIISGAGKRPSNENVMAMAAALGVSVDRILGVVFKGEEPPKEVETMVESYASVLTHKDDLLAEKEKQLATNNELVEEIKKEKDRFEKNNAKLTTVVFVLGTVLCLCCLALTAYFVYDLLNGDMGVFRY